MKTIGIVICNYNKSEYVVNCIRSVLASDTDDFDIYVVDNASQDDSAERIRECFDEKVTLLVNEENLGGSGGFNRGLRLVLEKGYRYALCLDNDVIVDAAAIRSLKEFLDTHPDTGMVGARVFHMEQPEVIQQFGLDVDWDHFCTEAKYTGTMQADELPEVLYCYAAAACCLMVRTEVMRKIGIMPEENFLYWDDTEWGYRCNLAGYRVAAYGRARVWHAMGARKESINTFPVYYAWRNQIRFFARYIPEEFQNVMARAFVSEVFEVVYCGMYRGEENMTRTVMLAYDDALHGVTGKAGENRIFPVDESRQRRQLKALLQEKKHILMAAGEFAEEAVALAEELEALGMDRRIDIYEQESELKSEPGEEQVLCILLCGSVFGLTQQQLAQTGPDKIWMDIGGSFVADASDIRKIEAYPAAKEAFLQAHIPLFLQLVQEHYPKGAGRTAKE